MTAERREAVGHLRAEHLLSERQACGAVRLSRSVYRYRGSPRDDSEVQFELSRLALEHPEYGFLKLYQKIRRRCGRRWNHKRVYRVYCEMKLNKRRKHKRRLPARNPDPLVVPERANECWSADFMSDALWDGRRFRTFNVVDDCNRQALHIEIDTNLPSQRVIRVLDQLKELRGLPAKIRFDNGPELTALAVADWAEANQVELEFIKPGRPMQNGFVERFNRTYREAVLDMYIFETLDQVRSQTEKWLDEYNNNRPHDSLGGLTPTEFLMRKTTENCNYEWR